MPNDATISAAIALGRNSADRILQERAAVRQRRQQALLENPRALSFQVRMPSPAGVAAAEGVAPEAAVATLQTSGFLVAAGDSWFAYPFHDVLKDLEDNYGYNVESTAHAGDPIEKMAYHQGQLYDFPRKLDKIRAIGAAPKAALLSGGGDDIAGAEFGMLLNDSFSPISGWNMDVVRAVLNERIYTAFVVMITGMDQVINSYFKTSLPILVHGYDYPVPDGRGYLGAFGHFLFGPWLEPGFREKDFVDLSVRIDMMKQVLDQFNTMVESLTTKFPFVRYVDVRNTLSTSPADYKNWWDNELHPTEQGFAKVTDKFAAVLRSLP